MPSDKLTKEAKKFALKNAIDYGKADAGAVINKVLASNPSLRSRIKEVAHEVKRVVEEVNGMSEATLAKEFGPYAGEFEKREEAKREKSAEHRMEVEGAAEGKVITRFPPEPGGYIQIGNAKQAILSEELAKKYRGKTYLYFDDTNPEKCKQEYVDGIKRDTEWLGITFGREYYASDFIKEIYKSGEKLMRQGDAYVCMCDSTQVKKDRAEQNECIHRQHTPQRNLELFKSMLKGRFDEGEAIVRLKGDMKSPNATFRDPTLFRIKKAEHYRQGSKYIVWPTYHINTPVVDSINGVTDVIRDTHYAIWDEVNKKMLRSLGIKPPRFLYQARLEIKGTLTSKRFIRKFIKEGVVTGWDDPRLPTIIALRRRGVQPQAIREFVLRFGMSKTNSVVPFEMLLAENKKIIDQMARHLFFVESPVRLRVKNAPKTKAKLRLHPNKEMGFRQYQTGEVFYISGGDASGLRKGETIRLKDLFAARIGSKGRGEMTAESVPEVSEGKIVQWVSDKNFAKCTVIVPEALLDDKGRVRNDSLKTLSGYVESYASNIEAGEIVQFERFGYYILDDKKENRFILTSK